MGYIGCNTFTFQSILVVEHFNKDLFEEPCDDDNANVPYTPDACMNNEFMGQARIIEPTEDQGLVRRRCWGSNRRNCMHASFTGVASSRRNCMYVFIRVLVVLLLGTTTTLYILLLLLLLLE